jgi:hypothetical protein
MKVLLGGKELETWSKVPRQPKETLPRHAGTYQLPGRVVLEGGDEDRWD